MRFHADRVDAGVGAAPARHLFQRRADIDLLVVDHLRAAELLRHLQALREAVDRDDALRAQHIGALDGEQPDRAASPDRDRVAGLNVAVLRRLIAGREDIGQEQHLIVPQTLPAPCTGRHPRRARAHTPPARPRSRPADASSRTARRA